MLVMALGSGPKNAGKKPSRRKKTNKTRATVTEVVDLLPPNNATSQHPTEQAVGPCQPQEVVSPPPIPPFVPSFHMPPQQHCNFAPLIPENMFRLKWVVGTTVSRCYGCNGEIKNPPISIPDDLVVVYRDIRQFRERDTGQLRLTIAPQNVHFHLQANCVRARYQSFPGASAHFVPQYFRPYFHHEYILRLNAEFGWTP